MRPVRNGILEVALAGLLAATAATGFAAGCGPAGESPVLGDVPRSILPCARLAASGTQPRGFWPFEAEDAIATVRDSRPGTTWKAPVGEPSWIEIDLQPLAAAPVALHALSIAFSSDAPAGIAVHLSPSCGAMPTASLAWPDPSVPLDLADVRAGCVRIDLPASEEGFEVAGLDLESREVRLASPGPDPAGLPRAGVRHSNSGAIEGFYGIPWSWRERRHMLMALAASGLDTYLYAPKNDPLHRDRWREPYPDEDLDRFGELADLAASLQVRFAFGVSPFLDYRGDEADYATLQAKCGAMVERGTSILAILADDIEFAPGVAVDAALGAMHVAVVNRLVADFAADGVAIWFTPTVYSDRRAGDWPGGQAYLREIAALDPSVQVLWTGPDTGNATLAAGDLAAVTAAIGRLPLIWDNAYANDGGDGAFGRIFLAPYTGRSPDLAGPPPAVAGIAQNLSIQGALSRISLAGFGAWSDDPAGADAAALLDRAIEREGLFAPGLGRDPTHDAQVLRRVAELFQGDSSRDPPRFVALEQASADLVATLKAASGNALDASAVARLLPLLGRMAALPSDAWHSGLDTDLVDELAFPLQKAVHEGRQGLWALSALSRRLAGGDASMELARVDDEALLSAQCRFLFSPDAVANVVTAVREAPPQADPPVPPTPADPLPAACRPGVPVAWKPYAGQADVQVFGLPGATIDADGTIRWTPPHGGRFQGVITASRTAAPAGWAWQEAELACGATNE